MVDANDGGCATASSVSILSYLCGIAAATLLICPSFVRAESTSPELGVAASGMRGLITTGLPLTATELNLGLSAGYGMTEAISSSDSAHHRAQATFGAGVSPLPWLSLSLKVDGRLEFHGDDGEGSHVAGFGDPRIFARAGYALSPDFAIGGELGGWFPGTDAPSIELKATSPELRGLFAYTPRGSGWVALAAAGFRLDNSGKNAPDLERLRVGDRITLGVSDSNAVLAALGLARRFERTAEVFGELSADILVGSKAPAFAESPLRASLGGRYFLDDVWQLDLTATASLSSRPEIGARDPLVPIEPRFLVMFGARYTFSFVKKAPGAAESVAKPDEQKSAQAPAVVEAPKFATVSGTLLDDKGEPLPEAVVTLHVPGGEERQAISDAQGQYNFTQVPLGPAKIDAAATGFETETWDVDVHEGMTFDEPRGLKAKTDAGVMRGLIRTFQSEPLRAQIVVRDRRGRTVATQDSAEDGSFEIQLAPGSYEVTISAPGYRTHRRSMKIEVNGVSILNVDMREGK